MLPGGSIIGLVIAVSEVIGSSDQLLATRTAILSLFSGVGLVAIESAIATYLYGRSSRLWLMTNILVLFVAGALIHQAFVQPLGKLESAAFLAGFLWWFALAVRNSEKWEQESLKRLLEPPDETTE